MLSWRKKIRLMGNEEHLDNDQEILNYLDSKAINSNKNKSRKKVLFGAHSDDTLFTLSRALNAFSDRTSYLVNEKVFKNVLTGREHNDPLEHRFSARICLGESFGIRCTYFYSQRASVIISCH